MKTKAKEMDFFFHKYVKPLFVTYSEFWLQDNIFWQFHILFHWFRILIFTFDFRS